MRARRPDELIRKHLPELGRDYDQPTEELVNMLDELDALDRHLRRTWWQEPWPLLFLFLVGLFLVTLLGSLLK